MDEVEQFRVEYHKALNVWCEHYVSCPACGLFAPACPIGYALDSEVDKRRAQLTDVASRRQDK